MRVVHVFPLLFAFVSCGDGVATDDAAPLEETSDELVFSDGKTIVIAAHNDDELLWFQPFLGGARYVVQAAGGAAPAHLWAQSGTSYGQKIIHAFPDPSVYSTNEAFMRDFLRRDACGPLVDTPPPPPTLYLTQGRDQKVTLARLREALRPYVADPAVRRIVTHNHWGEYGHWHHRLVGQAVRELAVQYGKDVWMLAMVRDNYEAPSDGRSASSLYRNLGTLNGLAAETRDFNHQAFSAARARYIAATLPFPESPGYNTWTWKTGTYDYPAGSRTWVKIVGGGRDHSWPASPSDTQGINRANRIATLTANAPYVGRCSH